MKYTGTIWRPPFEADSLLLQVTVGCSHNKCTFCSMYQDLPFGIESMDQVEADLKEARATYRHVERVFLVNADPFCLSGKKLKALAEKIIAILPEVKSIGMYASVQNIVGKSDGELAELRSLRVRSLNIGMESGMAEVLRELNKGFTLDEARHQLGRLNRAGIEFSLNIILGAAGGKRYRENALASAQVVNETNPSLIFIATLHLEHTCSLRRDLINGIFKEDTLRQTIEEERLFLENLDLSNTRFFGLHPSNAIGLNGILPADKSRMLRELDNGLNLIETRYLDIPYTQLVQGQEGAIGLK